MNTLIVEKQKYWEINSEDKVNFQIHFTNSILSQFKTIEDLSETNRVFLLVDENIWKIYKNQFESLIKNSTKKVHIKKSIIAAIRTLLLLTIHGIFNFMNY